MSGKREVRGDPRPWGETTCGYGKTTPQCDAPATRHFAWLELWGSGTQALWRLLSSMSYSADTVSLYEVVSRLDARNRSAVVAATAALCGDPS